MEKGALNHREHHKRNAACGDKAQTPTQRGCA